MFRTLWGLLNTKEVDIKWILMDEMDPDQYILRYFMNLMNVILGKHFIIFFTAWRLLGSCILTVKVHIFFIAFNIKEHSTCFGYLIFHLSECSKELMLWKQQSNIVRLDLIVWGLCCFYNCTTFLLQYYGSLFWHLRHFSFL